MRTSQVIQLPPFLFPVRFFFVPQGIFSYFAIHLEVTKEKGNNWF